jgi:SAM-dependent methyltransferase
MLEFDDEGARRIERMYEIGDAVRRRSIVREALAAAPGERILDAGCGPGFYCAELREDVGSSGAVVGVDSSAPMLALAARRCDAELREGDATALPAESGAFDAALCVQVLEYVPDVAAALAELHRVLRPGGRALVFDIDWGTLSVHSEDEARNARVLRAWDEHLAHPGLPRTLAARLRAAGFEDVMLSAHAFATIAFDPETYGAAMVPFIGAFVPGRQGVSESEARAWQAEQVRLGERGEFSFAVVQSCFTARKR